jgi:uncharacterized protein YjbJ (UPF0337 family)
MGDAGTEDVKGRIKEAAGAITGSDKLEREGEAQRAKAGAEEDAAALQADANAARAEARAAESEQRANQ